MSVEFCIGNEFDTSYEREASDRFVKNMGLRFGERDTLYLIIANYVISGRQVDLTVLKKDAVVVIELKECKDPFKAYENQDWITDKGHLIGSDRLNPYNQVRQYRINWFNLLKTNKDRFRCLKTVQDDRPFWYVKGVVAVCPSLHHDTVNEISTENWWFRLCGLNELDRIIEFESNKRLDFSDEELRFIATELLMLKKPKNISPSAEIHKMEKQLRESADGLIRMLESNNDKLFQLEKTAEALNNKIRERDEQILKLRENYERLNGEIREKDKLILELRRNNEQLNEEVRQTVDNLQKYKVKIEQLEADSRQQEEIRQKKIITQFYFVIKHILFNYGGLNKEKANKLIELSQRFGIARNQAIQIIKQAIKLKTDA